MDNNNNNNNKLLAISSLTSYAKYPYRLGKKTSKETNNGKTKQKERKMKGNRSSYVLGVYGCGDNLNSDPYAHLNVSGVICKTGKVRHTVDSPLRACVACWHGFYAGDVCWPFRRHGDVRWLLCNAGDVCP